MVFSTNLSGYLCFMIEINTWTAYSTPLFYEFNSASYFALTGFEVICVFDVYKNTCVRHIYLIQLSLVLTYLSVIKIFAPLLSKIIQWILKDKKTPNPTLWDSLNLQKHRCTEIYSKSYLSKRLQK